MDYRADNRNPVPVLYQSGYLTIKSYDERLQEYTLGFPNEEVKYGFFKELLAVYVPDKTVREEFYVGSFIRDLWAHNIESFMTRLKAFFADIPYDLNNREEDRLLYPVQTAGEPQLLRYASSLKCLFTISKLRF
jgi:hypothetical protein